MHAWEPRGGKAEGREVDVYLYASFLSSSLCLCLPNRSAYGYQADTRAALGSTDLFPKMAPLCFPPPSLFFLASPIKAIPIRSATLQPDAPVFAELGYRDDSLTGETREQTIARVCITTPADSCVKETQGSFVPSEVETLSWRS